MASNSAMNNMELPVSDPPKGGGDERLFRGSGMTKRGAYAAISYMACADSSTPPNSKKGRKKGQMLVSNY